MSSGRQSETLQAIWLGSYKYNSIPISSSRFRLSEKKTRNEDDKPGEESSEEEGSESEAEITHSTVTTATDISTTGRKFFEVVKRELVLDYIKGQRMFSKLCKKYNQHHMATISGIKHHVNV